MSGARPGDPVSPESRAWLQRVRANVKAQLFGGGEQDGDAEPHPPTPATAPVPEPELRDDEPARIGRFVVIKRIGEGGMGMVYAAYDDALDRKVAVKLLHPRGGGAGSDARARLVREAQALARLSHPSVIHVYEVDTWEDQVYVAMEFVDGGTLAQWQRQEGRGWREVLEAYVAAGRGLAAAHAAGIVHRDFKAANVLVRRDGAVRVVDFGLARQELEVGAATSGGRPQELETSTPGMALVMGEGAISGRSGRTTGSEAVSGGSPSVPEVVSGALLTRTGVIMGTPAYMAPEQHLGQRADARSDQFSYCVSLYEALYGFRPFAGEQLAALRRNVLAGRMEQPPRYTDIPPRILRALQRGLQVDPLDRYPSMEALLDELVRDPRVALQRAGWGLAALLGVGLVAGLWWSEREERAARAEGERLRAQLERARVLNAEEELRRAQSRSVSERRDDLVLAFAGQSIDDDPTVALAALKHLSSENTGWLPAARTIAADAVQRGVIHRRLQPGVGRVEHLAFVEGGKALVMAGRGIARWDVERRELQRLVAPDVALRDLAITSDGLRMVAVGQDDVLYQWNLELVATGPVAEMWSTEGGQVPQLAVALSDDGERIAVGLSNGAVRLLDWHGAELRKLRDHEGPVRALDFSPAGDALATASDDDTIVAWFLDREKHRTLAHGPGILAIHFDGSGQDLWSIAEDGRVQRWSTSTGKARLARALQGASLLERTPDGRRVLACHSERELMIHGEGEPQPLRGLPAVVTAIALSDDGTWAAAATGDEAVQVWRLGAGEGSQPDGSRIIPTPGPVTALASSNASGLLASATRQGVVQLWSERGEDRGTLGQHSRTIHDLGFSPQGHELAALDEDGAILVWSVADRDKARVQLRSETTLRSAAWTWSPDGESIAAPRCENATRCEVAIHPLSLAEPQTLGTTDSPAMSLRFSPSGDHLLSDHPTASWLWDLREGTGRALEWPEGEQQPGKRLAFAYVRGGVRMATSDTVRDEEAHVVSTTLRVWHIGQDSGDVHLLFEEPELRTLLVDADGRTLLLRTHDGNTFSWRLAGDHFRLLPDIGPGYDRLLVSPDARVLLLRPQPERDRHGDALWVDVESGQMRRFAKRNNPLAWSPRGTIADVPGRRGLRIWRDPTPDRVPAFLRWLHETTDTEVDPASIR
jgi:WD40 repeat protein